MKKILNYLKEEKERRRGKDNDVNYDKEKERRGRKGAELSRKGKERFSIKKVHSKWYLTY